MSGAYDVTFHLSLVVLSLSMHIFFFTFQFLEDLVTLPTTEEVSSYVQN